MPHGVSGIGTNISVTAYDADSGQNADLIYTVVSGNINGSFQFHANILTTVKALDKESVVHSGAVDIVLTIMAEDKGNSSKSGSGTVYVSIGDIDDNPPQFSQKLYTASVSEDAINVAVILVPALELTDADIDDCPGYLYSLSDNSTPFAINESSGVLFVQGKLDRETRENYTLQVIAVDNCGKGLNSSAEIFIEILDVDDEPPYFLQSVYNFSISKNSQLRHSVGTVTADDMDTSGGYIIYRLSGSNLFSMNPRLGEITLIGDLGRENTPRYYLAVSACDSGSSQQCGNTSVLISVTDICPVWNTTSLHLTAKEGETGLLGYISTLHDDLANVSYSLNDTDVAQWLEIKGSGEVILLTKLAADQADRARYTISVYADDYSQPNCSQSGTLTITVTGINNNDPEICYQGHCGDPDIEVAIFDGSPEKSLVALIAAHDNDTGPDGEVTLKLTSVTSGLDDLFVLTANGLISLQKQIHLKDIKTNSSMENNTIDLIVTASDHGQSPRSTNITVRVEVVTVQGDSLSFTNQTYVLNIPENEKLNTVVGTVRAQPSSPSSATVEYSMCAPFGNVPFVTGTKSGTITTTIELDREMTGKYLFTVHASYPGQPQMSAVALVIVNVEDVNERPKFDISSKTVIVQENVAPVILTTLTAHDDDEGSNGNVTYGLVSASSYPNFVVNESTGVLSVIQPLDRENISSYDLVIQAVDGGSTPLTATVAVHVTVADDNDHAPHFPKLIYEHNITKSEPPMKIITVTASDDDEGLNKDIVYSLETEYNTFTIDPLSGEIDSIAVLSIKDYTLVVLAKDRGNPSLNSTVDVIIRVTETQADLVPSLSLSTNVVPMIVGMQAGTQLNVTITTKYTNNLQVSGGNGTHMFQVQNETIVLSQDLTDESVYVLNIMAVSATGHNISKQLEIRVDRIKFDQQSYTAAVIESSTVPLYITDLDSHAEQLGIPVIYSLVSSDSSFSIDSASGVLWLQHPLDREVSSVYVLNVSLSLDLSVTSLHGRRKRAAYLSEAFTSVFIKVEDRNDNVPRFDNVGSELHLSVPASVNDSYLVTTLKAYDPDEGLNGLIRYSVSSGDAGVFHLNAVSGELRVASSEKLANHSTFLLTVAAADRNGTGNNISLGVWITIEQDDYQFRLSTPLSVSSLKENMADILRGLSRILGLTLSNVRVTEHEQSGNVDPGRSDIVFQAYQRGVNTTTVMSASQIHAQVSQHQAEIEQLLKSFETQPQAAKKDDMNATSISLIVVACVMFVATLVAIIVSYRMWKKQKKYERYEEQAAHERSSTDHKPKEDDGKERDITLNSGDVEMSTLSETPLPTSSVTAEVAHPADSQYLQQVQESLQILATESADSGIASPGNSDSEASGQESPVAIQKSVVNEDNNEASSSAENTAEKEDGSGKLQNEENQNPLVQKNIYVNVAFENGKNENRTAQIKLESAPTAINSSVLQEATSLTFPSQNALSTVSCSVPPISSSHDALSHNSSPDDLKDHIQNSDNNTAYHSTAPTIPSTSTSGLSFLNEGFQISEQADLDSDTEAITHF